MTLIQQYPEIYRYRRILKAKLYMDTHFSDKIDLSIIADEACFSKFHFIREFTKIYQRTPHQYLTFVRIEKAKQLLTEGRSVSETCFMVGFESVSTFTGLFTRRVQHTPARYHQKKIATLAAIKSSPLKFIPGCFAETAGGSKESNNQEAAL